MSLLIHVRQSGYFALIITMMLSVAVAVLITIGMGIFYMVRVENLHSDFIRQQQTKANELATNFSAYTVSLRQLAYTAALVAHYATGDSDKATSLLSILVESAPQPVFGVGFFYEPHQFNANQRLYGPYADRNTPDAHTRITYEWATEHYDYSKERWYLDVIESPDNVHVSEPYLDNSNVTSEVFVTFGKKILNQQGKPIGIVTVDTTIAILQATIEKINAEYGNKGIVYVTTAAGKPILHPLIKELQQYVSKETSTDFTKISPETLNAFHQFLGFHSHRHLSFTEIEPAAATLPQLGWVLHILNHENEQLEKEQKISNIVLSVIITTWLIVGLLLLVFSSVLKQSRFELQKKKALEREIAQREHNQQLLKALNEGLEKRVAERTQELHQAYEEIRSLNSRLKAENMRMGTELEISRHLQHLVLPKPDELKEITDLDIAGYMEPATEVGGDYYDVLQHNGHIKIGIGDVTGHGLESGVLMMMVQTAVRTLLLNNVTNPQQFLDILNRTIYKNIKRMDSDKNLTLSLLDYQNGQVKLSGQHEEVLVVRANGAIERIDTLELGFMVGIEENIAPFINQRKIILNTGDGIVLYTDGITEAFNLEHQPYTVERLCHVVQMAWQESAEVIKEKVIQDLKQHIGVQKISDDITLLIIKQYPLKTLQNVKNEAVATL
ncbi:serine phosphatase RsbU, regulator of sigma subunit [Beggiatoa alba B18LD]|uniref:Serine phosphatase RsbU, regulator of sigma subunit n=1 Tax=Beggiatoa alba B18LD TaxID=395493 RepID=I3CCK8_9GAMM|nr:SpoIIE family protein phosphatase [Beggiatoa alba]EIJ41351.1 serine phosphatase RsbU, regulator of sigma subunit [Beggiatoa alba B18LD]